MSGASIDRSRRAFLFGAGEPSLADTACRPPWALRQIFAEQCTGCAACVPACPEGIVALDESSRAIVDFRRGEGFCSFCGACAEVCPEPIFIPTEARAENTAWTLRVAIGGACLTERGVMCQSCKDACAEGAIRFVYGAGRIPRPELDLDRCTGCGACIAPCPVEAITIRPTEVTHA